CNATRSYIRALRISPDGRTLLAGGEAQNISVCDINSTRPAVVGALSTPGVDTYGITCTADSRRAVSCGSDNMVRVWDLPGRRLIRMLKGHTAAVTSCVMSSSVGGGRLFTGSVDRSVRCWDVEAGVELHRWEFGAHVYSLDLDPVAPRLGVGLEDSVVVRDVGSLLTGGKVDGTEGKEGEGKVAAVVESVTGSSNKGATVYKVGYDI
ncbi:hypothetical protein HK101_006300, partial [Irineochytrium annulatum]